MARVRVTVRVRVVRVRVRVRVRVVRVRVRVRLRVVRVRVRVRVRVPGHLLLVELSKGSSGRLTVLTGTRAR